jgi:hypothetical protein
VSTVVLSPKELGSGTAELARVELSFGGSAWLGRATKNAWPGPSVQVSVSQPAGPLVLGALVDWSARWFGTIDDGIGASPADMAAGVRVGVDLGEPDDGIVIRPSLGARYGYVPGIARPCLAVDSDRFSCANEPPADVYVYGTGRMFAPFAELSVDAWNRSRKNALGVGVKGSVEQAFGKLPPDSVALLPGGERVSYSVPAEARGFSATGIRALMNLTLAF